MASIAIVFLSESNQIGGHTQITSTAAAAAAATMCFNSWIIEIKYIE
jgi:hypothetical protein